MKQSFFLSVHHLASIVSHSGRVECLHQHWSPSASDLQWNVCLPWWILPAYPSLFQFVQKGTHMGEFCIRYRFSINRRNKTYGSVSGVSNQRFTSIMMFVWTPHGWLHMQVGQCLNKNFSAINDCKYWRKLFLKTSRQCVWNLYRTHPVNSSKMMVQKANPCCNILRNLRNWQSKIKKKHFWTSSSASTLPRSERADS